MAPVRHSLSSWATAMQTTTESRRWLRCLGWKTSNNGQQLEDGRWCVCARSCGHTVVALGDGQSEAWSATCAMALKVTHNGWARLTCDDT